MTIQPSTNESGSFSTITVNVPNESDTAGTTQIRVELPDDAPFPSVRVKPHPGWTAELETEEFDEPVEVGDFTLEQAVTSVTWTADEGVRIGPDEFDQFEFSVGPLPEPGTYMFPAIQTYDDGETVAWDMEPTEDGEEPPNPAPALTVVAAADGDSGVAQSSDTGSSGTADTEASGTDTSDNAARVLGVVGIVIGVAGVGIAAMAFRRRHA